MFPIFPHWLVCVSALVPVCVTTNLEQNRHGLYSEHMENPASTCLTKIAIAGVCSTQSAAENESPPKIRGTNGKIVTSMETAEVEVREKTQQTHPRNEEIRRTTTSVHVSKTNLNTNNSNVKNLWKRLNRPSSSSTRGLLPCDIDFSSGEESSEDEAEHAESTYAGVKKSQNPNNCQRNEVVGNGRSVSKNLGQDVPHSGFQNAHLNSGNHSHTSPPACDYESRLLTGPSDELQQRKATDISTINTACLQEPSSRHATTVSSECGSATTKPQHSTENIPAPGQAPPLEETLSAAVREIVTTQHKSVRHSSPSCDTTTEISRRMKTQEPLTNLFAPQSDMKTIKRTDWGARQDDGSYSIEKVPDVQVNTASLAHCIRETPSARNKGCMTDNELGGLTTTTKPEQPLGSSSSCPGLGRWAICSSSIVSNAMEDGRFAHLPMDLGSEDGRFAHLPFLGTTSEKQTSRGAEEQKQPQHDEQDRAQKSHLSIDGRTSPRTRTTRTNNGTPCQSENKEKNHESLQDNARSKENDIANDALHCQTTETPIHQHKISAFQPTVKEETRSSSNSSSVCIIAPPGTTTSTLEIRTDEHKTTSDHVSAHLAVQSLQTLTVPSQNDKAIPEYSCAAVSQTTPWQAGDVRCNREDGQRISGSTWNEIKEQRRLEDELCFCLTDVNEPVCRKRIYRCGECNAEIPTNQSDVTKQMRQHCADHHAQAKSLLPL